MISVLLMNSEQELNCLAVAIGHDILEDTVPLLGEKYLEE